MEPESLTFKDLRKLIDSLDDIIVLLLAKRQDVAEQIAQLKQQAQRPLAAPRR